MRKDNKISLVPLFNYTAVISALSQSSVHRSRFQRLLRRNDRRVHGFVFARIAKVFISSKKLRLLLLATLSVPIATRMPRFIISDTCAIPLASFRLLTGLVLCSHAFFPSECRNPHLHTIRNELQEPASKNTAVFKILCRCQTAPPRFTFFML